MDRRAGELVAAMITHILNALFDASWLMCGTLCIGIGIKVETDPGWPWMLLAAFFYTVAML